MAPPRGAARAQTAPTVAVTVFEIQRLPDGGWKESVIHSFPASSVDGTFPGFGDKLEIDKAGNLYGTDLGGEGNFGEIFRLHPEAGSTWTEAILHSIKYPQNGSGPSGGVVMEAAGVLFGTTIAGGDANCDCGVAYKLVPVHGQWTYIVLHRFLGTDGAQPDANLTLDGKGNIYGTTASGGAVGPASCSRSRNNYPVRTRATSHGGTPSHTRLPVVFSFRPRLRGFPAMRPAAAPVAISDRRSC